MWARLEGVQLQADILAFAVGVGSLMITSYIAILLHRLSRKCSQNEAMRSINERWDSFHNAMLNPGVHDLFWTFVRSKEPFAGLGERGHHIVLMYINNVHTEYYTYKNRIFADYDIRYLDTLLAVLVPKRFDIVQLAQASGYDDEFLNFMRKRLELLSPGAGDSDRRLPTAPSTPTPSTPTPSTPAPSVATQTPSS
jgi:hypothetical protein